jgi:release factor glutamine methyltransferase
VQPRTLIEVVRLSAAYLAQHGSSSSRLDAELLAAHALRLRRIDLYLQFERPLDQLQLAGIRELIRRRGAGEPVAYLTGSREFHGRSFAVDPRVLIPRPETETLVELALGVARSRDGPVRIADLGTGSGCIAVTLAAELPRATVIAVDADASALEVARRNAAEHGVAERVQVLQGSWADPLDSPVDLVVSNPPYVTRDELAAAEVTVREFEPRLALDGGDDGLDAYRALLPTLRRWLEPHASVLLEVDPRRAGLVAALLISELQPELTTTEQDLSRRDRVVVATMP